MGKIWGRACSGLLALTLVGSSVVGVPAQASAANGGPEVRGPITGGKFGRPFTSAPVPLRAAGYVEEEFFFRGTASGFQQAGNWAADGKWAVTPSARAEFASRMLVRRPADPVRFNGTVVVEWLNVTSNLDLDPDFLRGHTELLRSGYAWVGISAQKAGVDRLGQVDPERYAGLAHPGDSFSYDVFSSAARVLRTPGAVDPLGGLRSRRVLATGASQSAARLVTYANAIQPAHRLFDGFLVHSRMATPAPISEAPQAEQPAPPVAFSRVDLGVPLITVQSESDVVPYYLPARQADSAHFRLWETAGTAHVDAHLQDLVVKETDPFLPELIYPKCKLPINDGPQRYVLNAAVAQLDRWVRTGIPATRAPRLELDLSGTPSIRRDEHGNALGGIRTPALEAPRATLSADGNSGDSWACLLMGSTVPFGPEKLARLYPGPRDYPNAVTRAAVRAVAEGFLLPQDAAEIIRAAHR